MRSAPPRVSYVRQSMANRVQLAIRTIQTRVRDRVRIKARDCAEIAAEVSVRCRRDCIES